ncbi:YdeI/OmpD-associated family protein [Fodinibius sediminis]|uniref:Uncharacterized conserved protein YdeI, YjbR/CyaY-like superfamily, DUF1801 family n=1 Tax=Fodinibius sediminis TaxID=1214077 RepID=A0A521ENE2_9BACT|nr:YdeI/OmpD-associated family protein [Fodinibius sediminis]SMO84650.1 Uncharacterized conserved protein YdeI, YjbR/CyaY-like superfamily, DUF1801 family [Fodinibius sediminis]
MNPNVDKFLNRADRWSEEMKQLRLISLDCGLTESLKWGKPCYSFQESNILIIQPFKTSCALMFFKGVLLDDPHDVLEKPGEHSRVARRIPFTSRREIVEMEPILTSYIRQAVEVEKSGLEVDLEEREEPIPKEFQAKMDENPALKTAFEALTPGRQRGYLLYFSGAKQSKTRKRRVEKYMDNILNGKGLRE